MEGVFRDHFSEIHLMLACQSLNSDNELTLFIHDALRFISAFIIPISQRAPHVCLSALPFTPEQSHVAKKFRSKFSNTLVIAQGKPSHWPPVVFTAEHHTNYVWKVVFLPDESIFASCSGLNGQSTTIYICESETGHCISRPFELPSMPRFVCFSPNGKQILLEFDSDAAVFDMETGERQFKIRGSDFTSIHYGKRIASTHRVTKDGNSRHTTRLLVKLWDASNGVPISDRLFEVDDFTKTQFSPDGHFLAIGRKSENVIELWNMEDDKDPQRLPCPPGKLSSLDFSPTSDMLMAVSGFKLRHIYLWRLDTQEMVSSSNIITYYPLHVIRSPRTNYLFIQQKHTVEIWDASATGFKKIWETKPPATSYVYAICPSRDGHRLLVGYSDGSVRMWNVDLDNLAINQADTTDTQDDTDMRRVIKVLPSGKVVTTESQRSSNVEFLDTTTGDIVVRTDIEYKDGMEIAFSPDEDQVAFLSNSLITVCDIMHPEKRVSFNPLARRGVYKWKVAFQTSNDLVIGAIPGRWSGLLQVWHRQDLAGFECTYSLELEDYRDIFPAPDGLTVVFVSVHDSATCYSWNHDTAQFDLVHFDDQEHIHSDNSPEYSPDGKLLAYWSGKDSHIRIWDTRTRQLVSKFRTSRVYGIALSPAPIDHSPASRLIALRFPREKAIRLFDAYTGHLHAQILAQAWAGMAFIRDGKALAYYSPTFGLRIWDIAYLTAEHRDSTRGYKLMMQGMTDGWVMDQDNEPLFWVPVEHREYLYVPSFRVVVEKSQISTVLDFSNSRFGRKWTECINKEWLRELEQKEKEVGNLLE